MKTIIMACLLLMAICPSCSSSENSTSNSANADSVMRSSRTQDSIENTDTGRRNPNGTGGDTSSH